MKRGARIGIFTVLLGIAVALVVMTSMAFLRTEPITVDYVTSGSNQPVNLTIQTVGAIGFGDNPNWVSYLAQTPQGKWVHSTLWDLPANTVINVTIDQYDSGSPLRNPERGLVQGVNNPTLNGKPYHLIDATQGNGVGHTFSVPTLGINVPLPGVDGNAKNFCNAAPCPLSDLHNTVKFSFKTPAKPGQYRFQCFVPCGLGYLYGNGGPMSTLGYMGGLLKVVA